jgi:cell division protein FtsB
LAARSKPVVFNVIKAMEQVENLEAENKRLQAENEALRKERTNLEIKCRILEERLKTIG